MSCANCGRYAGETGGYPYTYCERCRQYARKRQLAKERLQKMFSHYTKEPNPDKVAKARRRKAAAQAGLDRIEEVQQSE